MARLTTYWTLLLLAISFHPRQGYAQTASIDSFGRQFYFDLMVTERRSMVSQPVYMTIDDTAVHGIFDKLKADASKNMANVVPQSPVILGVKLNPSLQNFFSAAVQSISKNYYTFLVRDSSEATVIAMGINPTNYRDFRYHIVENDSIELIPWSPISQLEQGYGAKQPYALLGRFAKPGKQVMIEVVNNKNYGVREGVIIDWRTNFRPVLEQIIVEVIGDYFNLGYPALNRGYATRYNRETNVPEDFRFYADSIRNISFYFKKQETLVRSAHLIRKLRNGTDTLRLGMVDPYAIFVLSENFSEPGSYELVFQRQQKIPQWEEEQLLRIPFEVLPPVAKNLSAKNFLIIAGVIVLGLLLALSIFYRINQRRIREMTRQKESALLKLKSIRSQLNPHFVFNALGSIQNLMNKQHTEEANHYLTRFATLTRTVLDSSEQDLISLDEELGIVDNYLQMERLRFGFSYTIQVDPLLQPANMELPPMLLQPFVENAVKHGIAGRNTGRIAVQAIKELSDLKLVIEDDGAGFDTKDKSKGFGMKLSEERIALLNQLYPGNPFQLNVHSSGKGTIIVIKLNNWI